MGLVSNKVPNCTECEFMKKYDYGKRIYYCDHKDRINDMGKLGVEYPTKTSPKWCPLRNKKVGSNRPAAS